MANNRMYLIHRPSGLGVMLGKRMAWGWYQSPEAKHLREFYDYLAEVWALENPYKEGDQDDFIIDQEVTSKWNYVGLTEEGFAKFESSKEIMYG